MPLINAYCTLAELKASLAITDAVDDTPLEAAIQATSRMIDDYTGRFFYQQGTTNAPVARLYTPLDAFIINMDDNVSISQIATDDNLSKQYDTVFATSDFMVEPVNNPLRGWPVTRVLAIGRFVFPYYLPQSVEIRGVWGWPSVPAEINMATLIQAARLFTRRQSPFGIAGSPDLGTVRLVAKLDADVEMLLRAFRRNNGLAK